MIGPVSNNSFPFQTRLSRNLQKQDEVLQRLATGRRINSGKDDPAGLIVAERLQSELSALDAESRNLERLTANAEITDGHLAELTGMSADLRGHLLAAANTGGLVAGELEAHQLEVDHLAARIQRKTYDVADSLKGIHLPDDGNEVLAAQLSDAAAQVSTLATGGLNELRSGNFDAMETVVAEASDAFATARGQVGAYVRTELEPRQAAVEIERESLLSAYSTIVDADYAEETAELARARVMTAGSLEIIKIAQHNAITVLGLLK